MHHYISKVTLTVLGPFLTAATGPESYGLDKSFHRDYDGNLVIPSSHVKGKLRMALEEIAQFVAESPTLNIDSWFGVPSAQSSYEPSPGSIHFTDFICTSDSGQTAQLRPPARSRVVIDSVSRTAAEHLLRQIEDPYGSGSEIECTGAMSFYAESDDAAQDIANMLGVGLKWLPNLGAEKGTGFGRLKSVQVHRPSIAPANEYAPDKVLDGAALHLRITALEPILFGGTKSRRTNYLQSKQEFSGGLLKGALAVALNEAHGIEPVHRELDARTASQFPGYESLITHYSAIRVTNGLPALQGAPRPVRIPISAVQHNAIWYDTALTDETFPLTLNQAPTYFVDWKESTEYFGSTSPQMVFVTRSEIDDISRRTLDGQLFTYSFCCPTDEGGNKIEWICNVDFGKIENPEKRSRTSQEFAKAVQNFLHRIGKLSRSIQVKVCDGNAQSAMPCKALVEDGIAVVTLQSNTIMLSPETVGALLPGENLYQPYADFWHTISSGSLELVDFFAHQDFEGGYLYHRYLGSAERDVQSDNYRPYYVTQAGSVFKLRVRVEEDARQHLAQWLESGIPLPEWANIEYGQYDRPIWKNCPYVPENGFGEIVVNLAWHWEKRI